MANVKAKELRIRSTGLLWAWEALEAAPAGYRPTDEFRPMTPGTIGKLPFGEPVVVLLDGDDGAWLDALVRKLGRGDKAI